MRRPASPFSVCERMHSKEFGGGRGGDNGSVKQLPGRRWLLMVTMVLVGQLLTPGVEARASDRSGAFAAWADSSVPRLLSRFEVPRASVAIVDGGEVRWSGDFARRGAANDDAVFEVASLSKTITALAVLRLAEQGRLDLDVGIDSYLKRWHLPPSKYDSAKVTARRLLTHTAGISVSGAQNVPLAASPPSIQEVLEGRTPVPAAVLDSDPGSQFDYSNPGYGVLELLVEEVSGSSFDVAVQELVFQPLGMSRSGFQDDPIYLDVLPGHTQGDDPARRLRRIPRGAGGVVSTASDIGRLTTALFQPAEAGGLLSAKTLAEIAVVPAAAVGAYGMGDEGGYALGVAVGRLPSGRTFLANEGSHEGYRSLMVAVPETHSSVTILTNSNAGLAAALEIAICWFEDTLEELPPVIARANTIRGRVRTGTAGALILAVAVLMMTAWKVRRGRSVLTRRPRLWPSLTTSAPAGLLAVALLAVNQNVAGDALGGLPPAKLVSEDYPVLSVCAAAAFAAVATTRLFTRRSTTAPSPQASHSTVPGC